MKSYLASTAPGTSSPRNDKLGTVREVMNAYLRALRESGNRTARVTLHGIHIYVNGQPVTISEIKQRTASLRARSGGNP